MIKGIAHLALNVSDMGKSMEFYCDILGFRKAFAINDDDGKPWIEYIKVCPGQFIELFYCKTPLYHGRDNESKVEPAYSHLCLEVDDIYEIAARIKEKGLVLDVEPTRGKDLNYQCWVKDPDATGSS